VQIGDAVERSLAAERRMLIESSARLGIALSEAQAAQMMRLLDELDE
jgi:hypothetical protein